MITLSFPVKVFYIAAVAYGIGFICFVLRQKIWAIIFLVIGLISNFLSDLTGRILILPFCNMFSETFFIPIVVSVVILILIFLKKSEALWLYPIVVFFALVSIFFSEGYYPPFTFMSKSIFAHIFHFLIFVAHSFLFCSGGISLVSILLNKQESSSYIFLVLGYSFLCLGGFFGMVWSFVGRGDVISWNHYFFHSIALWLYYSAILHLHLLRNWGLRGRAWGVVGGALLILWLDILPQIGGIHLPGILNIKIYELY